MYYAHYTWTWYCTIIFFHCRAIKKAVRIWPCKPMTTMIDIGSFKWYNIQRFLAAFSQGQNIPVWPSLTCYNLCSIDVYILISKNRAFRMFRFFLTQNIGQKSQFNWLLNYPRFAFVILTLPTDTAISELIVNIHQK